VNEEALARVGPQRHRKKKILNIRTTRGRRDVLLLTLTVRHGT